MEVLRRYRQQIWFHLVLNLVFMLFISFSTFYHIPLPGIKDKLTYTALLLLLQFTVFGFLYFLSLNKYLFAIIFPPLFLICGVSAYFVYTQDIIINDGVIHATLQTQPDIVADLVSAPLVAIFFLLCLLSFFFTRKLFKVPHNIFRSPLTLLAVLAVAAFFFVSVKRPSTFQARLPYNVYYGAKAYFEKPDMELKKVNFPLHSDQKDLQVILVLGESVRADHLGINGYHRNTTPNLSKRKNLVSFQNVFTNKTYTAVSLMQILTDQSVNDTEKSSFYSLIDVLNHSKIETRWIGNQTPEKSYLPFISGSKIRSMVDPYHSEFSFHKEFDEVLLKDFTKYLTKSGNSFTILHMMGSHWYYENRYPDKFRLFKPVINSKNISSNTPEEMVNAYDNTILYLDYFLDEVVSRVEKSGANAIVIYLADHGEALGENGTWLHAQDSPAIRNPAMMIWFSETYLKSQSSSFKIDKVNGSKITTDFLFPTVLDWFQIKGIKADTSSVLKFPLKP